MDSNDSIIYLLYSERRYDMQTLLNKIDHFLKVIFHSFTLVLSGPIK